MARESGKNAAKGVDSQCMADLRAHHKPPGEVVMAAESAAVFDDIRLLFLCFVLCGFRDST